MVFKIDSFFIWPWTYPSPWWKNTVFTLFTNWNIQTENRSTCYSQMKPNTDTVSSVNNKAVRMIDFFPCGVVVVDDLFLWIRLKDSSSLCFIFKCELEAAAVFHPPVTINHQCVLGDKHVSLCLCLWLLKCVNIQSVSSSSSSVFLMFLVSYFDCGAAVI